MSQGLLSSLSPCVTMVQMRGVLRRYIQRAKGRIPIRRVDVLLVVFGFIGLSYEVIATKVFFLYFSESSQSLALVLAIFLVALACGSLLYARYAAWIAKVPHLIVLQLLAALYLYGMLANADGLVALLSHMGLSVGSAWSQVLLTSVVLFPAIVAQGVVFPYLLSRRVGGVDQEKCIGRSNALDLIGSVAGSLLAGFYLIPVLGIQGSLVLLCGVHVAAISLFATRGRLVLLFFGLLVSFVLIGIMKPSSSVVIDHAGMVDILLPGEVVLYAEESPYGSVTVVRGQEDGEMVQRLILGKRQQCDTRSFGRDDVSEIHFVQRALDQVGGGLAVANIGLGCGLTAGLLSSSSQVSTLDLIEINPKVPGATRFFSPYNNKVLENPKTTLTIQDGYDYMRDTGRQYDVIALDVEEPTVLHSSRLYSVENFQNISRRLAPGGVATVWAFNNFDEAFSQVIFNSLSRAFEWVYVVQSGVYKDMYFLAAHHPLDEDKLKQSNDDRTLQGALENSHDVTVHTLEHNALGRFWQQLSPREQPKN